jgi:hypothetical protein
MLTIGLTAAEAEEALVRLSGHLPMAVPIGRPRVAWRDPEGDDVQVLTDTAVLWSTTSGATRLIAAGEVLELTRWRDAACTGVVLGDTSR